MTTSLKQLLRHLNKSCLLISLLFLLPACFPRIDPRWGQVIEATNVTPEVKAYTCKLLTKRSEEISSIRTLSNITANTSSGYQGLRLSMVFQFPNKIRFEVLPPTAALALYIANSNADKTLLLEPTAKKATTVKDPQELIAKLIKVRILPYDLAYILAARVPPHDLDKICPKSTDAANTANIQFLNSTDGPGVTIFDNDRGQYWTVAMQSGLLRTALLRRVTDEWPVLAADFQEDDFADPNNLFPRSVDLVLGNQAFFATIEPSIVKMNTVIAPSLFELQIPAGYVIEEK